MATPRVIEKLARIVVSPEDGSSNGGAEYNPAIAGLSKGGFVAVWDDFLPVSLDADGSVTTMVRLIGKQGASIAGPARPVSRNLKGAFGGLEAVVSLGAGLVAVAWDAGDTADSRVGAQLFEARTGAAVGPELSITSPGRGSGRDNLLHGLVALPGGRAGVLYVNRDKAFQFETELRLVVLTAEGVSGPEVVLLRQSSGNVDAPFVASLGSGSASSALQGSNAGVFAVLTRKPLSNTYGVQFFTTTGEEALPAVPIGDTGGYPPILVSTVDGGAALAWGAPDSSNGTRYTMQRLDASGALQGPARTVALPGNFYGSEDLLGLPDGGLLLAATTLASGGGFRSEIALQRFDAEGNPDGEPLILKDDNVSYNDPRLTLSGEADVIVAYEESGNQILATGLTLSAGKPDTPVAPSQPILGTDAADRLRGTPGQDVLDGRGGNDVISGLADNDRLLGGAGQDRLDGGSGNDTLIGGADNDVLIGGSGRDVYRITAADAGGRDSLLGWEKGDRISLEGLGSVRFLGSDPFPGGGGAAAVRVLVGRTSTVVQFDSGDADNRPDAVLQLDRAPALRASDFLLG